MRTNARLDLPHRGGEGHRILAAGFKVRPFDTRAREPRVREMAQKRMLALRWTKKPCEKSDFSGRWPLGEIAKKIANFRLTFSGMSLHCKQFEEILNGVLMKQTQKMLNWLVAGGVALAMVTSLAAQTVNERSAQVVRLKGHARYSTGGTAGWQDIKVGTKIRAGYLVQTAADSYVDIVLGEAPASSQAGAGPTTMTYQSKLEQDIIRVTADSVVAIDKATVMKTGADEVTDTQLDLRAGKIMGSVKKMSPASRYEIKLPNGVAGVRGTVYTITAAGVVQVHSGSMVISWTGPDGKPMTQVVNANYQFNLSTLLLSEIPPGADVMPTGVVTRAREVTVDRTFYYVSPKVP